MIVHRVEIGTLRVAAFIDDGTSPRTVLLARQVEGVRVDLLITPAEALAVATALGDAVAAITKAGAP